MTSHGWSTRRQPELAKAHFPFELVAENETAIAFFTSVSAHNLRHRADSLAGAIGAITLQRDAGVKAWEAYLLLIVEDDYATADVAAQEIQRDLDYCRKIVLDGVGIAATDNPRVAMERALSFLFPLEVALKPTVEDVRRYLVDTIGERGFDESLVSELVSAFDREADCKCWERVKQASSQEAAA
jgi:hypothetical protein